MAIPNLFNIGRSGMQAAKASIATAGHNIANANTEGYSRQRVQTENVAPQARAGTKHLVGQGTQISRIERVNDAYLEKQVRNAGRDLANLEEKDVAIKQLEDIFNEMGGDGLNRLISKFFNEFRKLSNEPENEGVRQSVREATQSMVSDFKRLRKEVEQVREHLDSRIEGYTREVNTLAIEIEELNQKIVAIEVGGGNPNDLLDKRDAAMKKLSTFMDLSTRTDEHGSYVVDIKGIGPLVVTPETAEFSVQRTPADDEGKPENAYDVHTTAAASSNVTHRIKGGKLGALLETRDQLLSAVVDRLDDLAFGVTQSVNQIHKQGFTRTGFQGVEYFKNLSQRERAAEFISLSDAVMDNVNNIAAAAQPDAPGDNRVALAISSIQNTRVLNGGQATFDDWYNAIVSDIGVAAGHTRFNLNQQKDVMTQLNKMRDQISGVSIDEETANLMQFQQVFGASAKVIQIADEMLETVLAIKR